MLCVAFSYCYAECHDAECLYAECRGASLSCCQNGKSTTRLSTLQKYSCLVQCTIESKVRLTLNKDKVYTQGLVTLKLEV